MKTKAPNQDREYQEFEMRGHVFRVYTGKPSNLQELILTGWRPAEGWLDSGTFGGTELAKFFAKSRDTFVYSKRQK